MGDFSEKTHKATDLDLVWDEAAQRLDESLRDNSYRPDLPRDLNEYLRFLEEVAPDDPSQGRGTSPVDEQFTLPQLASGEELSIEKENDRTVQGRTSSE